MHELLKQRIHAGLLVHREYKQQRLNGTEEVKILGTDEVDIAWSCHFFFPVEALLFEFTMNVHPRPAICNGYRVYHCCISPTMPRRNCGQQVSSNVVNSRNNLRVLRTLRNPNSLPVPPAHHQHTSRNSATFPSQ